VKKKYSIPRRKIEAYLSTKCGVKMPGLILTIQL